MLSHKKSLDILRKTNALLEGHFVLSSGLHSSKYILKLKKDQKY